MVRAVMRMLMGVPSLLCWWWGGRLPFVWGGAGLGSVPGVETELAGVLAAVLVSVEVAVEQGAVLFDEEAGSGLVVEPLETGAKPRGTRVVGSAVDVEPDEVPPGVHARHDQVPDAGSGPDTHAPDVGGGI